MNRACMEDILQRHGDTFVLQHIGTFAYILDRRIGHHICVNNEDLSILEDINISRYEVHSGLHFGMDNLLNNPDPICHLEHEKSAINCLKITQNVAFEFLNFGIFHQFLSYLKLTCLVTLFDRKLQVFKNSPKWTIFGIF